MKPSRKRIIQSLAVLALALVPYGVYWPGIGGGFFLDDADNLYPVQRWLYGDLSFLGALFGNQSGVLGRSVAMLSFLLNAQWSGLDPVAMKLTNMGIHGLCGVALFFLARRILRQAWGDGARSEWVAGYLALIWLLLPIHVSTVLYVVQRMAQLSALFVILALLVYFEARTRIQKAQGGRVLLWLAFPLLAACATLSKENGVLAFLLALTLEMTLFAPAAGEKRPAAVYWFFFASVGLPAAGLALLLIFSPERILTGYEWRQFTLMERLLTEPRVLFDYIKQILLPYGPKMGLFHEHYEVSRGWFSPPSTVFALLGCAVLIGYAIRSRRTQPLQALGILFFFAAHALESTFIPLELYFEHRNYLASFGVLLFTCGAVRALFNRIGTPTRLFARTLPVLAFAVPLVYAGATLMRSGIWGNAELLYLQGVEENPGSVRLRSVIAFHYMRVGDFERAMGHIQEAERYARRAQAPSVQLWKVLAHCYAQKASPTTLLDGLQQRASGPIDTMASRAFELVVEKAEVGDCPGLDAERLANIGLTWLDDPAQVPAQQAVWATRYHLARLLASRGAYARAMREARQAWIDSRRNVAPGVLLFQLSMTVQDYAGAREVLDGLKRYLDPKDRAAVRAVAVFEDGLKKAGAEK